jgi:rSAM/selenodomain-associated transferase 1
MTGTALVMAKAPRPGTVKTRLHPLLGPHGCARLQAALIRQVTGLTGRLGLTTYVAVDPPDTDLRDFLPNDVSFLQQVPGDLGARMAAAVTDVFAMKDAGKAGEGPLVVLGTDAPTLTLGLLRQAYDVLDGGADVVLGPAVDGGYYLIGMRELRTGLFALPPELWSGPQVLTRTLALAKQARLAVRLLPELRDLDTPADADALLDDPLLPAAIGAVLRGAAPVPADSARPAAMPKAGR